MVVAPNADRIIGKFAGIKCGACAYHTLTAVNFRLVAVKI
jgi:hypothetical protein